jgi:hypothetical protein
MDHLRDIVFTNVTTDQVCLIFCEFLVGAVWFLVGAMHPLAPPPTPVHGRGYNKTEECGILQAFVNVVIKYEICVLENCFWTRKTLKLRRV